MGLDMYLTARTYVHNYQHSQATDPESYRKAQEIKELFPDIISEEGLIHINFPIAYWRKANHIHSWFVNNVQEGRDDCGEYYISKKGLESLKDACEKSIDYLNTLEIETKHSPDYYTFKEVDKDAIPLQMVDGFFFGSVEYDSQMYDSTMYTLELIIKLLENYNTLSADIYYTSSW